MGKKETMGGKNGTMTRDLKLQPRMRNICLIPRIAIHKLYDVQGVVPSLCETPMIILSGAPVRC